MTDPKTLLANASVDDAVAVLRPDYRALLIAVDGLPAPSSGAGEASKSTVEELLVRAERSAAELHASRHAATCDVSATEVVASSPERDVVNAMYYFARPHVRRPARTLPPTPRGQGPGRALVRRPPHRRLRRPRHLRRGRLPAPAGASQMVDDTPDQDARRAVVSAVDSDNPSEDLT